MSLRKSKRDDEEEILIEDKADDGQINLLYNIRKDKYEPKRRKITTDVSEVERHIRNSERLHYENLAYNSMLLNQNDLESQIKASVYFSSVLSWDRFDSLTYMLREGVVRRLIYLLKTSGGDETLQYEILLSIVNISCASQQQIQVIFEENLIPTLITFVSSRPHKIAEQAMWALGNLAVDVIVSEHLYLKTEFLTAILYRAIVYEKTSNLIENPSLMGMRHIAWILHSLSRVFKNVYLDLQLDVIKVVSILIQSTENDLLVDVCGVISNLCLASNKNIYLMLECKILSRLIKLVDINSNSILKNQNNPNLSSKLILNCDVLLRSIINTINILISSFKPLELKIIFNPNLNLFSKFSKLSIYLNSDFELLKLCLEYIHRLIEKKITQSFDLPSLVNFVCLYFVDKNPHDIKKLCAGILCDLIFNCEENIQKEIFMKNVLLFTDLLTLKYTENLLLCKILNVLELTLNESEIIFFCNDTNSSVFENLNNAVSCLLDHFDKKVSSQASIVYNKFSSLDL